MTDRIVAIGLLTQHDLDLLGSGFDRAFALEEDDAFADLVARLDQIPAVHVPDDKHEHA
ncbi:hypothetical protein ACFSC3_19440 [Sphingomonas floccifaciens]|uniref:Uncharacterized protein n=1 Tax=Sphingomonas floccifaciens TaxID=1844115 RepID=A0ABW4NJI7_9SPHN